MVQYDAIILNNMSKNKLHKGEVAVLLGVGIAVVGVWIYNSMFSKVRVGVSGVDGRGIIANQEIDKGDSLGIMKNGSITEIGKNVNHSKINNAKIEQNGGEFELVATCPIKDNEEVFIDYELNPLGFSTSTIGFE